MSFPKFMRMLFQNDGAGSKLLKTIIPTDVKMDEAGKADSATNDGAGKEIASSYLPLSGGTMSGAITFGTTAGIHFQGTKADYQMIRFLDNASDTYGNGIGIGGGGAVYIGGGESVNACITGLGLAGGDGRLIISNDGLIDFYTNCQSGTSSAKHFTFNADGSSNFPSTIYMNGKAVLTSATVPAYITATYHSGASWYLKFSNGFILQGGKYQSGVGSNRDVTISLPTSFSSSDYVIVTSYIAITHSVGGDATYGYYSKSTSNFKFHLDDYMDGIDWITAGY